MNDKRDKETVRPEAWVRENIRSAKSRDEALKWVRTAITAGSSTAAVVYLALAARLVKGTEIAAGSNTPYAFNPPPLMGWEPQPGMARDRIADALVMLCRHLVPGPISQETQGWSLAMLRCVVHAIANIPRVDSADSVPKDGGIGHLPWMMKSTEIDVGADAYWVGNTELTTETATNPPLDRWWMTEPTGGSFHISTPMSPWSYEQTITETLGPPEPTLGPPPTGRANRPRADNANRRARRGSA